MVIILINVKTFSTMTLALRFVEVSQIRSFVNRPRIADVSIALLVTNVILSTGLIAGRIWYEYLEHLLSSV